MTIIVADAILQKPHSFYQRRHSMTGPSTKRARRTKQTAPVAIPLDVQRNALLKAAGFTHDSLADRIFEMDAVKVSRQTVTSVLAGLFENDDVIRNFCEVTGHDRSEMFPPKPKAERAAS